MEQRKDSNGLTFDVSTAGHDDQTVSPQYFSGNGQDGAALPSELPNLYFDDSPTEASGENDPKRRRIARACDMCRKKKIKCDGKTPKCSHCSNYKTECIFTHIEKKRNPPRGAKYIEGLENRLGRMEQLLKVSGLLTDEEAGRSDLASIERKLSEKSHNPFLQRKTSSPAPTDFPQASRTGSQPQSPFLRKASSHSSPTSPEADTAEKSGQLENLSDLMCSLITNGSGETRYIGSSSAFSIFSQKGIEWVNDKTGDKSFQDTIQQALNEDDVETKHMFWQPELFGDLFVRKMFICLPRKEEGLSLLRDYFDNFNNMFPLFHEPTFMHLVEKQYSGDPYDSSGWWGCLNMTFAIAYKLRVMSKASKDEDDRYAWLYMKNAMTVITELLIRNPDLLGIQALLGCALFLQGTANPQPSFVLISSAIRMAHSIGLHKNIPSFSLNPIEAEQRKRVFWLAYMLDKDCCLRSGRPSAQNDDDMNVDLPSEDPADNIGSVPLADGSKLNLFRKFAEFAVISGRVYNGLYSVKASKQSDGDLLNTIGSLDEQLEQWKDSIPKEFRPEHEIKVLHAPLLLHIVILHFSYYSCLATIHRPSVHHGYWSNRLSNPPAQGLNLRPLNPRVFSSAALCIQAARASINLIKYMPQGDFGVVWLVLYYPVSALVTIFANILQNPQDIRARADTKLMDLVVNFLGNVVKEEGTGAFRRMYTICSEFTRIARLVLDKAENEGIKRKRKVFPEDQQSSQAGQSAMAQAQQFAQKVTRPISPGRAPTRSTAGSPLVQNHNVVDMPCNLDEGSNLAQSPTTGYSKAPRGIPQLSHFDIDYTDIDMSDTNITIDQQVPPVMSPNGYTNLRLPQMPSPTMSINGNTFQQPFVPQDLWQMPMAIGWDMFDLTNQDFFDEPGGGGATRNDAGL